MYLIIWHDIKVFPGNMGGEFSEGAGHNVDII